MRNEKVRLYLLVKSMVVVASAVILILFSTVHINEVFASNDVKTMMGGPGNDSYYIDQNYHILIENPLEGIDTVYSSVSYKLKPNFENLTLVGTSNINATGNELDNIIIGNSGNNILEAKDGNDTYIYKLAEGYDTIIDTSGIDTLKFGIGISQHNIRFIKDFPNLKISFKGMPDSGIIIKNFFSNNNNKIENFTFSDDYIYRLK